MMCNTFLYTVAFFVLSSRGFRLVWKEEDMAPGPAAFILRVICLNRKTVMTSQIDYLLFILFLTL